MGRTSPGRCGRSALVGQVDRTAHSAEQYCRRQSTGGHAGQFPFLLNRLKKTSGWAWVNGAGDPGGPVQLLRLSPQAALTALSEEDPAWTDMYSPMS